MKKFRSNLARVWQPALLYGLGIAVVASLLFFRLGTLIPRYSASEIVARENSKSIRQIISNPVNAPHKLGQYVLQKYERKGPLAMRSISAFYGLMAVVLFYLVLKYWFTTRIAALGSLLLASSSWFLHIARLSTPDILLMTPLALLASGLYLRLGHKRHLAVALLLITVSISLYVPGTVWLVIFLALWQAPLILKEVKRARKSLLAASVVGALILVAPLVRAIILQPGLLQDLAGLPRVFGGWDELGKNFLRVPVRLFARGPLDPVLWLGRLPILDVFSAAMFGLGCYSLYIRRRLDRSKLAVICLIGATLLIALNGLINLTIVLPFIYLVVTGGFTLLLQQWFTVFPRNPLARGIAVSLLTSIIALSVIYHTRHYFVAWPNSPETKQAFTQTP